MGKIQEMMNYYNKLETGAYNFQNEIKLWLSEWCKKYLADIYNQIINRNIIDLGNLLQSFDKGEKDNIWIEKDGGLTIEVGSKNPYGAAVNNGHKTCPDGVAERWVPGEWQGNSFRYNPNSKTGMLIKQKWIDAKPFFTSVERYASKEFAEAMSVKQNEWLEHIWA